MIPLSVPCIEGNEWKYIKECLDTNWVSSVGSYVTQFEESVASYTGAKYAISTVNGTAALHISLLLSEVMPKDLVIVPNITFIASLNSIKYVGADPILIDICPNTWQMDLDLLQEFLETQTSFHKGNLIYKKDNRRIKAIMPVHVLGNLCNMERLVSIASKYNLTIIEDSTEALGSYFNKRHAGTYGKFGCFSFNGNKIITTGGGGMIVTNDEILAKRAKHITTQAKADPYEYYHDEVGYNYRLVNILAAMGVAQMEKLPDFLERKERISQFYKKNLITIPGIIFQEVKKEVIPNNWLFTISIPNQKEILAYLKLNKIEARPFWVPMNKLPMFSSEIYYTHSDYSNEVYKSCISLPCSVNITNEDLVLISEKLHSFTPC